MNARADWATDSSEIPSIKLCLIDGIERRRENKTQCGADNKIAFLVAMRLGETPVHIPNTMVKT